MRILDEISSASLKNITLFLTHSEASELRDSLDHILKIPINHHAHISSNDYLKEITICIYDLSNLNGFNDQSKNLILNDT